MRESVRLQKPRFYQQLQEKNKQVVLLLSYHAKEVLPFKEVDNAVTIVLKKLITELH